MRAWFAGRRGGVRGGHRTAVRGMVAAVIGAVLACVAGLTVIVAGASAGGSHGSSVTAEQARAEPSEAKITFEDNFDGPNQALPDSAKWVPKVQTRAQSRTGEIQYYTDNRNAYLDGDGHLVIKARRESRRDCPDLNDNEPCYTSGRLSTKGLFSQEGGRFAARIKMPIGNSAENGGGVWPAWWLLGRNGRKHPDQGEIDIDESTGAKGFTHGFFHGPRPGSFGGRLTRPDLDMNQFNTFAVDVEPTKITWSIDGAEVQSLTRAEYERRYPGVRWVANQPWYLILNLAIGGWPGRPSESLQFPKEMVVDWVRASCPFGTAPFGPAAPENQDQSHEDNERVRCAPGPGQ